MQKRILLIDDEAEIRILLEQMLREAGYQVDAAASATEGGMLLAARSYDLVIADGRLGDGCGIVIADAAVAEGAQALIITGNPRQFAEADLARHEFLKKPIYRSKLLDAVGRKVGPAES